jgi:hypothetical protein
MRRAARRARHTTPGFTHLVVGYDGSEGADAAATQHAAEHEREWFQRLEAGSVSSQVIAQALTAPLRARLLLVAGGSGEGRWWRRHPVPDRFRR